MNSHKQTQTDNKLEFIHRKIHNNNKQGPKPSTTANKVKRCCCISGDVTDDVAGFHYRPGGPRPIRG